MSEHDDADDVFQFGELEDDDSNDVLDVDDEQEDHDVGNDFLDVDEQEDHHGGNVPCHCFLLYYEPSIFSF